MKTSSKMKKTSKMKTTLKMKTTSKKENNLKNDGDLKNGDDLKNKDNLKMKTASKMKMTSKRIISDGMIFFHKSCLVSSPIRNLPLVSKPRIVSHCSFTKVDGDRCVFFRLVCLWNVENGLSTSTDFNFFSLETTDSGASGLFGFRKIL